jgi:hypothetical protein
VPRLPNLDPIAPRDLILLGGDNDQPWPSQSALPDAVVACASTPIQGGFYTGEWEDLITHPSMGGYGALKTAFAEPGRYLAVATLSPDIFPGRTSRQEAGRACAHQWWHGEAPGAGPPVAVGLGYSPWLHGRAAPAG